MRVSIITLVVAFTLTTGVIPVSASEPSDRTGSLHVTKECSQYSGNPDDFCSITSSNLAAIKVGSKVFYDQADGTPKGLLDSNVVLDAGAGNRAIGRCTVDDTSNLGLCTFSDGTGQFAGFQARVLVDCTSVCRWNGTYQCRECRPDPEVIQCGAGEIALQRIRDHLATQAAEGVIGRREEQAVLLKCIQTGRSACRPSARGGRRGQIDPARNLCHRGSTVRRNDRPFGLPRHRTDRGRLSARAHGAIGADSATVEDTTDRLAVLGDPVVVALDNYEVFRLMDGWLHQVFAPALPDNVRLVLVGREPPAAMWIAAPGWYGLSASLSLGPLAEQDALDLLCGTGLSLAEARRLNRFARGHPLALRLATVAAAERPGMNLEEAALQRIIEELARVYLAEVSDPLTRRALEAASVTRRVTVPLLGAMLPDIAPADAFERLRHLPFVETARDGLMVHDGAAGNRGILERRRARALS